MRGFMSILMHLGDALDKVRKQEYAKLDGEKRKFIKGQKYALLSHQENLQGSARKNLKILLAANKRLNTAYVLKESFGQLWDYNREAWARKFFENWRDQLKWQRLKPYEKFAEMIDTHWDGIAAYCKPENKVPLGFGSRCAGSSPRARRSTMRKAAKSLAIPSFFEIKESGGVH